MRLAISILLVTMANAYGANIESEILPNGKHIVVVDGDHQGRCGDVSDPCPGGA